MKIYLVGGAVRDALLRRPVTERDWVVVGATPEQMLALGYKPVGKDFPVFLHPQTHEEYALARTERKVGKGYKGFTFYADPQVSLEQDLKRRDLTINAIAQDAAGKHIDPFGGEQDLSNKILRHVSEAFAEDPVRILRLARFAATFPDFSIHADTIKLMQQMVENGEVDALVSERVWQEFERALGCTAPARFIEVLHGCGALSILFPPIKFNGAGVHALSQENLPPDSCVRFALLLHDLQTNVIQQLITKNHIPNRYAQLATTVAQHSKAYQALNGKDKQQILRLLLGLDALRRPERFQQFLMVMQHSYPNSAHFDALLLHCLDAINKVSTAPLLAKKLSGKFFGEALQELRLQAIAELLEQETL